MRTALFRVDGMIFAGDGHLQRHRWHAGALPHLAARRALRGRVRQHYAGICSPRLLPVHRQGATDGARALDVAIAPRLVDVTEEDHTDSHTATRMHTQDGKRHKVLALPPNSTGLQALDAALHAAAYDSCPVPCWRACMSNGRSVCLAHKHWDATCRSTAGPDMGTPVMWQGIVSLNTLSTMTGFRSRTHMTVIVTGLADCPAKVHLSTGDHTLQGCVDLSSASWQCAGARTSTMLQRLPYLPVANAYVSENGGRIFWHVSGCAAGGCLACKRRCLSDHWLR